MNKALFALAKFIPDIKRMEPRNCGIVVWNRGECVGRFVGDDKLHDSRQLTSLRIADKQTYFHWLEYWRAQMARDAIRLKSGDKINRTDPEFLNALCSSSIENFQLNSVGYVPTSPPRVSTGDIVESLFESLVIDHDLVITAQPEKDHADILRKEAARAIEASGLADATGFRRSFDWLCPVGETLQHFKFHYGVHTTKPEAVLQKINLHRQSSVNDAAFMFQAMQTKYFGKDKCAAVVYADDDDLKEDAVYQSYNMMKALSQVINVADYEQAIKQFASMAA